MTGGCSSRRALRLTSRAIKSIRKTSEITNWSTEANLLVNDVMLLNLVQ